MPENRCTRCGAYLTDGHCEYCGWNCPNTVQDKTLTLSGLLCNLTVTKEICTFVQKVGAPSVIQNKEISKISLSQAPVVGSGELLISTITGVNQKITFLYPQNANMEAIVSYLLHVAPNAQFVNTNAEETPSSIVGVVCPQCKSNNTQSTGESRRLTIWKIAVGAFIVIAGFGSMSGGIAISLFVIALGLLLAANGFGIIGKRKLDCFCMNCRKRFRV